MAEHRGGGENLFLGAVIGALVISVLALGFFVLNTGAQQTADIRIEASEAPDAG